MMKLTIALALAASASAFAPAARVARMPTRVMFEYGEYDDKLWDNEAKKDIYAKWDPSAPRSGKNFNPFETYKGNSPDASGVYPGEPRFKDPIRGDVSFAIMMEEKAEMEERERSLGATRFTGGTVAQQPTTTSTRRSQRVVIEAKKGKPNVPINQRGNYVAQEKMQAQMANMKPEANGYPLFNLYVQTPRANMWYPCGSLKGDDRSKSLVDGWIQNGLGLGGMVKSNIDKSVASSVFQTPETTKKLTDQIVKMYPALKEAKKDLTFGYKVEYENLEEKQEVTILTPDMKDSGPLSGLRKMFGGN